MAKRLVIANAFSINMLSPYAKSTVSFIRIGLSDAKKLVNLAHNEGKLYSIVGHVGTAKLLSEILGVEIKANREFYVIEPNDVLLVASIGARLPEGKVLDYDELKEFAKRIDWYLVRLDRYFI